MGYCLLKKKTSLPEEVLQFRVTHALPTDELENFVVASDGIAGLEKLGEEFDPSALWKHDSFFNNQDAARRFLVKASGGVNRVFPSVLQDDTTFVACRRRNPC